MHFIKQHVDFKFYTVSVVSLVVFLLIFPSLAFLPQKYGYENSLLENLQMLVLFGIGYLCLSAKYNKRIFRFAFLALIILILREVNLGRTLFFPNPDGSENFKYYSWKDINAQLGFPLGKCVHFTYGLYIAFVAVLFIVKGIFKDGFTLLKTVKLPFWNLAFMGLASFMGAIAEKATNNNFIFEEGFELLFYVSLLGVIYLYTRNEKFKGEEN